LLAEHFLRHFSQVMNKQLKAISPEAQQKLLAHHWPGNVRELRNVIERAVILETTQTIQPRSLPDFQVETRLRKGDTPVALPGQSIDEQMDAFERELINTTLGRHQHNLTRTAEDLKISRHALRYRMQRLNIHTETEAEDETAHTGKEATPC
jgi:transcriptional regulator with PAS, ATPase and Fis domain